MRREVDPDVYCPQAALIDEETSLRTERRLARHRAKFEHEKKLLIKMQLQQRHQQRMYLAVAAGGALVVTALSLIWYKRYSQKQATIRRRRRDGKGEGGLLPRDLLLDEDDEDGFDGTEEELQQVFDEASKVARNFSNGTLDQRDQLMLYGLYKQATMGDRNDDAVC